MVTLGRFERPENILAREFYALRVVIDILHCNAGLNVSSWQNFSKPSV